LLAFGVCPASSPGSPAITEFMAANASALPEGDGAFSDWIEITNTGGSALDLAGWHLSDSADDLTRWTFPSVVLAPGGRVVVFASGRDPASPFDGAGFLHTSFRLSAGGEFLALAGPDRETVATEFRPGFPPQSDDVSYGTPDGVNWGYYTTPSPGAANPALPSLAQSVAIDPPGGAFSATTDVTLTSQSLPAGAVIRFTLDGSQVTAAAQAFSGPVQINSRTHLRARVFLDGFEPGPESDAVFVRAAADAAGFTSNLTVVVVDTDGPVPPTNSDLLVGAHALVFDTDPLTGRSALAGVPDSAGRAGLRVRGRSSAGFPKRQYKFETWGADGGERNVSLLGMGGESDWVLHGPYTDKSLMRNALAYSVWGKLGWPTVDTRFVEVFLNDDRGAQLSYADDYVGVYLLVEGITIDDDRVDIEKPEDTTDPAAITGGYIIESGNADSQQFTTTGSRRASAHRYKDPNIDELNAAQRAWVRDFIQEFEVALYGPGFRHPDTGQHYSEFTDTASQVDYKVIREWSRNFDGGSAFSYIPRGGKLTMGPVWDFNWALGNVNYAEGGDLPGYRTDGWNRSFTAAVNGWPPWWLRFEADPDWWQGFIDRWSDLRGSVLSDASLEAEIEAMAVLLEAEAAGRNFERWPVLGTFTVISPPGWQTRTTFRSEVDYLKGWLRDRSAWIDTQWPARPLAVPPGGPVSAESPAHLSSQDERGTIYYTTDDSDPRLPGGEVNPVARPLAAAGGTVQDTLVSAVTPLRGLRPTGDSPGPTDWTLPGYDDSGWASGGGGVGYENAPSDYSSLITLPLGYFPGLQPTSIYVRCPFEVGDPASYTELTLRLKYDDGFVAYLNGREVARRNAPDPVAWNAAATDAHPEDEANLAFEEFDLTWLLGLPAGQGLVPGTNVLAVHALNLGTPNAGNTGSPDSDMLVVPELVGERATDETGAVPLTSSAVVTARAREGTGWGPRVQAAFVVGRPAADATNTLVSEIHYHPAAPDAAEVAALPGLTEGDLEWVELHNSSAGEIDLTGLRFVEGIRFGFPAGTVLAPGGFLVVASDPDAFAVRYPAAPAPLGPFDGALDNAGERLELAGASGQPVASFEYNDGWHPASDGDGFSLNIADESAPPASYGDPGAWAVSAALHGSPGAAGVTSAQLGYGGWLPRFFSAAEILEGTATAPGADPEGDGLPNIGEFAFGRHPRLPDAALAAPLTRTPDGNAAAGLTFTRPSGLTGIVYALESALELSGWSTDTGAVWAVVEAGDGTETVTVTASVPPGSGAGDPLFLRVRVTGEAE
jgi:hypothetical protein